jgi:uncharacterized paraquat-inducible protein A
MSYPIAILELDSRSWGPSYCEKCDEELEQVMLTSNATLVCPTCKTQVEGFDDVSNLFVSARPVDPKGLPGKHPRSHQP